MPSQTKDAIKEAFLKLLEQRALSQITVKDIVESCGVNRNSFYYHFEGIPQLVSEIITESADQIVARFASPDTMEECLQAGAEFALQNKRIVLHIYRSASRDMVEDYLMRICRHTVESFAKTAFGQLNMTETDREILVRFFQCECFGQVIAWLNDGMRYDLQAESHRLCQLMHGLPEELLRRCAQRERAGIIS